MKIVDWEKSIGEKYWFKKESNINNLNLYLTEKKTRNLLGVLKRDNLIIYLSTQDNVHLTGVYSNIPQEFYKFYIMYLNFNFLKGQIIAQEYVDFFASRGFIFKEAKNCKEELQDYADAHKLSVFKLTDRKIKDKDFYAFYVFDDSKIFGKDYKENCFGEFEDTIIFIGSKDEVNIDNIYIMSSIDKSSKAWQKFSEMVNKDLVK